MEQMRILAAAVALRTFTVRELVAYTGASPDTVRSTLGRNKDQFAVEQAPPTGPGRPLKRWTVLDPDAIRGQVRVLETEVGVFQHDVQPRLDALMRHDLSVIEQEAAVAPGERLIYGTCSLLPAENEDQLAAFLRAHEEFQPLPIDRLQQEGVI